MRSNMIWHKNDNIFKFILSSMVALVLTLMVTIIKSKEKSTEDGILFHW